MTFVVEIEQEEDGFWIKAKVQELGWCNEGTVKSVNRPRHGIPTA